MVSATLRTVGGSVMVAIPKPLLDSLGLSSNSKVGLRIEDGRLVVEPQRRPKYSLDELLAQCEFDTPLTETEREWDQMAPVGREII